MKKLKYLTAAALIASVSAVSFIACDKDDDPKGKVETEEVDAPQIAETEGAVTIVAHFKTGMVCEGGVIAFPGSYKLVEGKTDWVTTPADLLKFEAVGTIDGKAWPDWYKVVVPVDASAAGTTDQGLAYVLGGKPVQLAADGSFNWDYQTGDMASIKVLDGAVEVVAGYSGEANIYFTATGVAIIEFSAWKNNNSPCVAKPKHNYTFNVTVPEGTPEAVYIAGNFQAPYANWSPNAENMKLTKVDATHYTITLNDVSEGTEYKFLANGSWDNEECVDDADTTDCAAGRGNRMTGAEATINDVVANFKGITTCVAPPVAAGTGTFTVTITSGYVEGSKIIFTGNFAEKGWGDSDREMTKSGDTWTWTGDYPAGFQYKVIMRKEGAADVWAAGENVAFDGTTFTASFSFAAGQ